MEAHWPVRTATIPEYGFVIRFYDPTIEELERIAKAQREGDENLLRETVIGFIKDWTVTDRNGNPMPVEPGSLNKVPPKVLTPLVTALLEGASGEKSPKVETGSDTSQPSTPEPVETK